MLVATLSNRDHLRPKLHMTDQSESSLQFNVLLVAPNWLGDVVMFSALVEFLHQQRNLPGGTLLNVGLVVRSSWAPLFEEDNRVDFIFTVDRNGRHGGFAGGFRLGRDLRKLKPAAIILGPPSFRMGLASFVTGANLRIGYNSDARGFLLTHKRKVPPRGAYHHSQELVQLGRDFMDALGWNVEEAPVWPQLSGCHFMTPVIKPDVPLWILAPGATFGSAKSWSFKNSLEFVRSVVSLRKAKLVVLGDLAASDFTAKLIEETGYSASDDLNGNSEIVDLTGKTDLKQVVSILKSCQVFVGNDSGLMHLAGALKVPTVGVFGSSNPQWTHPCGPRTRVVVAEGFACQPCYLKECNQKEFCLDSVSAQQVMLAVDEVLATVEPKG